MICNGQLIAIKNCYFCCKARQNKNLNQTPERKLAAKCTEPGEANCETEFLAFLGTVFPKAAST